MKIVTTEGKEYEGRVQRFTTGWRLESFTLDQGDVQTLCEMSDRDLVAHVRQLNGRCHENRLQPVKNNYWVMRR